MSKKGWIIAGVVAVIVILAVAGMMGAGENTFSDISTMLSNEAG